MTNEEKAREYSEIQIADTITERRIREAYLNACEWKDQQAREAFCLACCEGKPHRSTCTSLGTCDTYDRFSKLLREGI